MKDKILMSVTKIVDDETGIWASDLCEVSVHFFEVESFLKIHKKIGADAIIKELEYLKKETLKILGGLKNETT